MATLLEYWTHRLTHNVRWLWPLLVLGAPPDLIFWQVAALGATGVIAHANIAHVDPTRTEPGTVGVDCDPIPRSFVAELLSPVTYRRLVRNRAAARRDVPVA